jgi:hypothetical protein
MTDHLIAKPVINNQYWIVTDGKQKVGNVLATGSGFEVKIGGTKKEYPNTRLIASKEKIEFEHPKKPEKKETNPYSTYPTGTKKVFNSILDVRRKIHLFTKTTKSKCYHAAGWFVIKQGPEFNIALSPKYIFIQRYECYGPYETEAEAKNVINTL